MIGLQNRSCTFPRENKWQVIVNMTGSHNKGHMFHINVKNMEPFTKTHAPSRMVTFTTIIHSTNASTLNHSDKFNYPIFVVVPVAAAIVLVLLIIFLVLLIRRKLRKRRLRQDLVPHYGYDPSEADVFDGYTQYTEGLGSVERLVPDEIQSKIPSPESTEKSDISLEFANATDFGGNPNGTSTPNSNLVKSVSI